MAAAAQEERFTREKHDHRFPGNAVRYCLHEAGVEPGELDHVAFYDKPWLKFERLLETYLTFAPAGFRSFVRAMPLWLKQKLFIEDLVKREVGWEGDLLFPEHHQSHAASAFYMSPFDEAAVLTVDGVGEWATAAWGVGRGGRIDLLGELHFPHSLGLLYSAFTYYTGFRVNSGEYKVMGLAPYGEPRFVDRILGELMDLKPDGSFRLDMSYFNYCQGLTMTSEAFHRLFGGPPREPESPITQRDMDLARSVQEVTEEVMLRMARFVRHETGQKKLCLAGGVALNCVANGKILREGVFDDLWIQPAAGDAGGALGAAKFVWHQVLGNPLLPSNGRDRQRGSYLGPAFGAAEIAEWAEARGYAFEPLGSGFAARTAELIAGGNVVGWFDGRMEFGPRALGARSILGDPRDPSMQQRLNLKIKHRESFRPFGPSCLAEDASEYFDLDRPSPYMLLVAPVRPERRRPPDESEPELSGLARLRRVRSDIPAVTHVDYSARIQTVDADDHPRYRAVLAAFKEATGCSVLINTSFNVRGEPIVCTPADAYRCFMATGMDALIMEGLLFLKEDQPEASRDPSDAVDGAPMSWTEPWRAPEVGPSARELRTFGLVLVVGFGLLGALSVWRGRGWGEYLFWIAGGLAPLTVLLPRALAPVRAAWLAVGSRMGEVVTRVILFVAFYVAITPLGLAKRLFTGDSFGLRFDERADTYWRPKGTDGSGERPDKPF